MQLNYKLKIDNPSSHYASINISGLRPDGCNELVFFIPSWSPGSYLMREYGRNVRCWRAKTQKGENLYFKQIHKGQWLLDFNCDELKSDAKDFSIDYDIFCHELTVRTSHIDDSHAFIHGPSVFMGILNQENTNPTLQLNFPALWSKVTTGLKDISSKREVFEYSAINYDELIDSPIEIGCHETDGFTFGGKDHELAFFGNTLAHKENLKKDIQKIVEHISTTMGGMPYEEKYTFITHFIPNKYGGLEHLNSTALQFCSFHLSDRKGYLKWLELVAHEYFHTWNVKRIRPKELGPFDYINEGLTRMHWLTEGLTSFMDQLFILRMNFCSLEEYTELMKENFNRYFQTPGRKFHSLEDSSFNAWIKLYRPDESSSNTSISYYLKGGIVFFALNSYLSEKGKGINDLLHKLWNRYLVNPKVGLVDTEVFDMVEEISNKKIRVKFETMIQTTEELDIAKLCKNIGMEVKYSTLEQPSFGFTAKFKNERVFIATVILDGAAYKSGLNADDEILAIEGMRLTKENYEDVEKILSTKENYEILVSRLGVIRKLNLLPGNAIKLISEINVVDEILVKKSLGL
ncbi:MAG: M61 family metallopeptidase [Bacteriovoracaceae bacterium]|jgi:predicted metalloprotease with PDZ domain|nr:M61 family metallopeptidase [Bacteriovoracaceae bacterium]